MPKVATPADRTGLAFPVFPEGFTKLPVAQGYHEAHQRYTRHKEYLQAMSMACNHSIELVTIQFRMKTLVPGRKTPLLVGVRNFFLIEYTLIINAWDRICAKPLVVSQFASVSKT
jgi:hypothetical protein